MPYFHHNVIKIQVCQGELFNTSAAVHCYHYTSTLLNYITLPVPYQSTSITLPHTL